MEIILSFTALIVSICTNLYLVKKLTGSIQVEVVLPEQKIEVVVPYLESKVEELAVEPINQEPLPPFKDESRYAWTNKKGIPMTPNYSPSPGSKPPAPGPLERPAGFVR